jgi:hypothetical protein
MESLEAVQAALVDDDRTVDAFVSALWAERFPNNHRHEKGVTVRVFGVQPAPNAAGYEIQIGYKPEEIWVEPIEVRLGWNLCDGCKAVVSACCCDEIEAEREAEYGPWCGTCGSDGSTDYGACIYRAILGYAPGECSQITGAW